MSPSVNEDCLVFGNITIFYMKIAAKMYIIAARGDFLSFDSLLTLKKVIFRLHLVLDGGGVAIEGHQ